MTEEKKNWMQNRSCFNCVKSKLCFAFKTIYQALMELPAAKNKSEVPGTDNDVIDALANCCREYQEKKSS